MDYAGTSTITAPAPSPTPKPQSYQSPCPLQYTEDFIRYMQQVPADTIDGEELPPR